MKKLSRFLPEFVYGGIDGLVTTFSVVAGATGAHLPISTILILGFANLLADGFSMSIGNYLSVKAAADQSRQEGRKVFIVPTKPPWQTALATFAAFNLVGIIPLSIFIIDAADNSFALSCIATSLGFILIGAFKARVNNRPLWKEILFTWSLGAAAATVAYTVGVLLDGVF